MYICQNIIGDIAIRTSKIKITCTVRKKLKCDIVCEKGPYGGTNSVILNQLFLHVCVGIFSSVRVYAVIMSNYATKSAGT